jgi:hypothetical protein
MVLKFILLSPRRSLTSIRPALIRTLEKNRRLKQSGKPELLQAPSNKMPIHREDQLARICIQCSIYISEAVSSRDVNDTAMERATPPMLIGNQRTRMICATRE